MTSSQRSLGKSGLAVSPVIFGAMDRGDSRFNDDERMRVIEAAVDAGMTSIDTAPLYEFGRSEELVGRVVKGRRDQVQILTKVGLRYDADHDGHGRLHFTFDDGTIRRDVRRDSRPESVRLDVEASLRRLGVDTLDLVQVHSRDLLTPVSETMGALKDLKQEGKLRAIGVCNYSTEEMLEAVRALGDEPLASHQLNYSLLKRYCEQSILPTAHGEELAVLAHTPLASGALTGRDPTRLPADDPRRKQPICHPRNNDRLQRVNQEVLAPIAGAHDATIAQVCLAWLLGQPGMAGVIAGATTVEQARQNARAMTLSLTAEELCSIREAFEGLRIDRWAGRGGRPAQALDLARRAIRKVLRSLT